MSIRAKEQQAFVLAVNGGSSSVKFALYQADNPKTRLLSGKIDRIGLPGTRLGFNDFFCGQQGILEVHFGAQQSAANFLIDWIGKHADCAAISAVGHRVVHGGAKYSAPQRVTPEVLDELRRISPYDPEHMPAEIELIEAFRKRYPKQPQVACFDTAFHREMPRVARILPIPRRFDALGVQRYGFHGLSYAYLMEELARVAGAKAAQGRVILAHLGNGASLAAVLGGKSIDTSMSFTPAAGLPMGTRSGDLDPGLVWYLARTEQMTPEQFNAMVNHQSGLLGVSGISSDTRDLLAREKSDAPAAEALALFCYQTRKWIGAFSAALGGLETLVFSAGIGENAPEIRARICENLGFLGLELSASRNAANAAVISAEGSRVTVRVIPTDEERMIARAVSRILKSTQ